jgi:hypothetical protein
VPFKFCLLNYYSVNPFTVRGEGITKLAVSKSVLTLLSEFGQP